MCEESAEKSKPIKFRETFVDFALSRKNWSQFEGILDIILREIHKGKSNQSIDQNYAGRLKNDRKECFRNDGKLTMK